MPRKANLLGVFAAVVPISSCCFAQEKSAMATTESIRRAAKLLSVTSELPNQKDAECYADSAFRRSLLILVELVGPAASFPSSFDDVADIVVEVTVSIFG